MKADDFGVGLARCAAGTQFVQSIGKALVRGMPVFLKALSAVGTAAMIWVGGGIIVHGLEEYGFQAIPHAIHAIEAGAAGMIGALGGFTAWVVHAVISGIIGLIVGAMLMPLVGLFHKKEEAHA